MRLPTRPISRAPLSRTVRDTALLDPAVGLPWPRRVPVAFQILTPDGADTRRFMLPPFAMMFVSLYTYILDPVKDGMTRITVTASTFLSLVMFDAAKERDLPPRLSMTLFDKFMLLT